MSLMALLLILLSSFMHASWNLIAKRAVVGGAPLVWLFAVFETIVLLPLAIWLLRQDTVTLSGLSVGFMVGSGVLHTVYFVLLTTGYRVGDLSIVYPLARGIGPLFATFGAILLLAERPSLLVLCGTLIICAGVIILTGDPRKIRGSVALPGLTFGILTGLAVAAYTLWDAYAVNRLLIAPVLFATGVSAARIVILLPYAALRWPDVQRAWHYDKWKALLIAALSSVAYLLILAVLVFTPVSYVAPMRTLSILIGVLMGTNILNEKHASRRLSAAAAIVIGVVLLNIG